MGPYQLACGTLKNMPTPFYDLKIDMSEKCIWNFEGLIIMTPT